MIHLVDISSNSFIYLSRTIIVDGGIRLKISRYSDDRGVILLLNNVSNFLPNSEGATFLGHVIDHLILILGGLHIFLNLLLGIAKLIDGSIKLAQEPS